MEGRDNIGADILEHTGRVRRAWRPSRDGSGVVGRNSKRPRWVRGGKPGRLVRLSYIKAQVRVLVWVHTTNDAETIDYGREMADGGQFEPHERGGRKRRRMSEKRRMHFVAPSLLPTTLWLARSTHCRTAATAITLLVSSELCTRASGELSVYSR